MYKRIYLDAGHGGADSGAVKYVKEAEETIKIVKHMAKYLRDNYECIVYEDITADSLAVITHRANEWGADLFVSIHENAGGGDGYECFVYDKSRTDLGQTFEKRVLEVGQNSRGVKYDPELIVLNSTDMPAILNEIAFVDNKKDIADWDEPKELKKMAAALGDACGDYLDMNKARFYKAKNDRPIRKKNSILSKRVGTLEGGETVKGFVHGTWLKTNRGYIKIINSKTKKRFMERVN